MKVIVVLSDSLRIDHIGAYGNRAQTPNLDKFAKEATIFNRCYIASYPTVPNRADIWTGRYTFPHRGWQPLDANDVILPEILGSHHILTQLITDTPPLLYGNFHRGFSGWWYIRGHHSDRYITDPTIPTPLPAASHKLRNIERTKQYLRNRYNWQFEKDYIAPRTFTRAIEWLERNHTQHNFLLFVDTWDPHEPFDPPRHYLRLYDDLSRAVDNIIYPRYGRSNYITESELRRVKALYAGEVTMVDTWFGELLATVDRLGLRDETMILFTSDHGHSFGEHKLMGKPGGILGTLYEVTTHIPLIIRYPQKDATSLQIDSIVQPPDLLPTILDAFQIPTPETVEGKSLLPLIKGEAKPIHEFAISARFLGRANEAIMFDGFSGPNQPTAPITITKGEWTLISFPNPSMSELYQITDDPEQLINVKSDYPDTAHRLRQYLITFLETSGTKSEWIEPFKKARTEFRERLSLETTLYVLRDETNQILAFPTKSEAKDCLSPKIRSPIVEEESFSQILLKDPKALIYIEHQYYWAEELQ